MNYFFSCKNNNSRCSIAPLTGKNVRSEFVHTFDLQHLLQISSNGNGRRREVSACVEDVGGCFGGEGRFRGWQGLAEVGRRLQILKWSVGIGGGVRGAVAAIGLSPINAACSFICFIFFPQSSLVKSLSIALPPFVCTGTPTSFTGQYLPHQRLEENHSGGRRSEY